MTPRTAKSAKSAPDRRGPEAVGSIVKRYRKRDHQFSYGLRIRAYGERFRAFARERLAGE